MAISGLIPPVMRNVLEKVCRMDQNTHFWLNNGFFDNRAVYGIIRKNMVKPVWPQMRV